MTTTEVPTQSKTKRILKFLFRAALTFALAAIVLGTIAHFVWKYSGSNQWEKIGQRKNVTVYALKQPGSSIKKFKAVWTVHGRLSSFVAWASDIQGDTMHKKHGLRNLRVLKRQGEKVIWTAYQQPIVEFLDMREWVIRTEFAQDPKTKTVLYTVNGVPDMIPPDNCCVRIPVMNNSWTLIPKKNDEVQVEWYCDMDLGGSVPYLVQNQVMPDGMFNFASRVESYLHKDKYKNATVSWIQEKQL